MKTKGACLVICFLLFTHLGFSKGENKETKGKDIAATLNLVEKELNEVSEKLNALQTAENTQVFSEITKAFSGIRSLLKELKEKPDDQKKADNLYKALDSFYGQLEKLVTKANRDQIYAIQDIIDHIEYDLMDPVYLPENKKLHLRFQLQEGKTYRMLMTLDQKVTQTVLGQKQDMVQLIRMGLSFQAGKTGDDALIPVKVVYDSAYYKSDGPFGNVEYDSANPPSEVHPMAMGFAGIVGKSFNMKMTPDGQVKEVTGVDDMISQVLKKLPLLDDERKTEIENQIREQFGDKATLERMENLMAIYPDKPVGVGDSWKKNMLSRKPPMKIDTVWKLKSRKDGIAKIEVHSKIKPNPGEPVKSGGLLLSISVTGEQKGTLEVDERTGWLMNSEVKQKLSGKATVVEGIPDLPKGTTWPLSVESAVRFEGVSAD